MQTRRPRRESAAPTSTRNRSIRMNNPLSPAHVDRLRCENLPDGCVVDERHPRFSWIMQDKRPGAAQVAFELEVTAVGPDSTRAPVWSTGRVESPETVLFPYAG